MIMRTEYEVVCCHIMTSYIYNTSAVKFAEDIFGKDQHQSYTEQWVTRWVESPVKAIGMLDKENFKKMVAIAFHRYGEGSMEFVKA